MSQIDPANAIFSKAVAFVTQTNSHLFLTGKAGTGKTTFLKYVRDHCSKKTAIVAPTGVAAINAGGVTIHSFFQLPMGTYLPTNESSWETYEGGINNQYSLFKNLRLSSAKRELLRELELLIIDEVSMVRADTLDAIDAVLRNVRQKTAVPFGGVQVVYIGDLFQLPPVVKPDEWKYLQEYYRSPFFFEALALEELQPVYIELKKIYRQSDARFIDLLNNIRNNCCTQDDMQQLHEYYRPYFVPPAGDNYITLTSHNEKADAINRSELDKLPGRLYSFNASISGEFNERSYPAEELLHLKEGAQIMFIKNDKGENRRYYNGKIGRVERITDDEIQVSFPGESAWLSLETEKWQNIRYTFNREKDKFEEEELGTFTQYPVRLAWAITIHKSQGLTFDKAIIDAGSSFAAGQVYVALSRLTGLEGLVLRSKINPDSIRTDERILQFVKTEMSEEELRQTLEWEQQGFIRSSLVKMFGWEKMKSRTEEHLDGYDQWKLLNKPSCLAWAGSFFRKTAQLNDVASKFIRQLEQLLAQGGNDSEARLNERVTAAVEYFSRETNELNTSLTTHIDAVRSWPRIKKYLASLNELKSALQIQKDHLDRALSVTHALTNGTAVSDIAVMTGTMKSTGSDNAEKDLDAVTTVSRPESISRNGEKPEQKTKRVKGESFRLSLNMFREGKSIADIAQARNLARSTIESHLAGFIISGELDIHELITEEKLAMILGEVEKTANPAPSVLKQALGDSFSYGEIHAAIRYMEKLRAVPTNSKA